MIYDILAVWQITTIQSRLCILYNHITVCNKCWLFSFTLHHTICRSMYDTQRKMQLLLCNSKYHPNVSNQTRSNSVRIVNRHKTYTDKNTFYTCTKSITVLIDDASHFEPLCCVDLSIES